MHISGVHIEDTFAEAFAMKAAKVIVTAVNRRWALNAAQAAIGFATSIIACQCEAGIDALLEPADTPDGRPGVELLFFTVSSKHMEKQLLNRIGQCIMTCPTTACYDGLPSEKKLKIGGKLRYFGDTFQSSKWLGGRRIWRVPMMDGEYVTDESISVHKAIGGGNFFILAQDQVAALAAAEAAIQAMKEIPGVIMPFPGGVVRSGSKLGSRYKGQAVSVNTGYCPTIRKQTETGLPDGVNAVLEIVIDGLTEQAISQAMQVGIKSACRQGVVRISAGNYGGELGQYHFGLRDIMNNVHGQAKSNAAAD